jgi:N-acetyl-alpha-D-muramate 1-phosphate uridylyltransferase
LTIKTAFLFAAGRGERMGALTANTPKPLLPVGNTTLIDITLQRLQQAGINRVIINTAYLAEKIEAHVKQQNFSPLQIDFSREPYPLETAGALYHARALLDDKPMLMLAADVWTDLPLAPLLQKKLNTHDVAHLVMVNNPAQHRGGDFLLSTDNRLSLADASQSTHNTTFTYSGIGIFSPALINTYPHCREKFPLREVFNYFIERYQMSGELHDGEWSDIGTPERLEIINKKFPL